MKREHVVISCAGMVFFFMALSFVIIVPGHVGSEAGSDLRNVIMGYSDNRIEAGAKAATISGGGQYGFPNRVTGDAGSIGGGAGNEAESAATIGGGIGNTASGIRSTIGGGQENRATRDSSIIGGGFGNLAEGSHATVARGMSNAASEVDADGIALAAVQGLLHKVKEKEATIQGQRDEIRKMKENISAQMRRTVALEERLKQIESAIPPALPTGH